MRGIAERGPQARRPLGLGETGPPDDQDDKSRITGNRYVRICGSPGVRFPRATRLPEQLQRSLIQAIFIGTGIEIPWLVISRSGGIKHATDPVE